MRHQIAGKRLNRTTGARNALRRNLIKQLFEHERIKTTKAKAAAVRGDAEKLITLARNSIEEEDSKKVHARRLAAARLGGNAILPKLFDDIIVNFIKLSFPIFKSC